PDRRDHVFDPSRNVLYITTDSGRVQRWDVATQQLLAPWDVGTRLLGADITPDNNWLYVTEGVAASGNRGVLHLVNLNTGVVTDATYALSGGETGGWDVAIAANGHAFITSSGNGYSTAVREYDPGTGVFKVRTDGAPGTGAIQPYSLISRGPDRKFMAICSTQTSP